MGVGAVNGGDDLPGIQQYHGGRPCDGPRGEFPVVGERLGIGDFMVGGPGGAGDKGCVLAHGRAFQTGGPHDRGCKPSGLVCDNQPQHPGSGCADGCRAGPGRRTWARRALLVPCASWWCPINCTRRSPSRPGFGGGPGHRRFCSRARNSRLPPVMRPLGRGRAAAEKTVETVVSPLHLVTNSVRGPMNRSDTWCAGCCGSVRVTLVRRSCGVLVDRPSGLVPAAGAHHRCGPWMIASVRGRGRTRCSHGAGGRCCERGGGWAGRGRCVGAG